MYAVDETWETDLEPGTWYRIVLLDRPSIIAGYVFIPLPLKGGAIDYRDVDGKPMSKRDPGYRARTAAWDAAIRNSKAASSC